MKKLIATLIMGLLLAFTVTGISANTVIPKANELSKLNQNNKMKYSHRRVRKHHRRHHRHHRMVNKMNP